MIIANNILERWNELKEHSDISAIADKYNLSRMTIHNAFKLKRASSTTVFAIDEYFKNKKSKLSKINK